MVRDKLGKRLVVAKQFLPDSSNGLAEVLKFLTTCNCDSSLCIFSAPHCPSFFLFLLTILERHRRRIAGLPTPLSTKPWNGPVSAWRVWRRESEPRWCGLALMIIIITTTATVRPWWTCRYRRADGWTFISFPNRELLTP